MTDYYVYIVKCEKWKMNQKTKECSFIKYLYYTGMTSDPKRRLEEHKNGVRSNWMVNNNIRPLHLEYIENTGQDYWEAIKREKEIKRLSPAKKLKLINSVK